MAIDDLAVWSNPKPAYFLSFEGGEGSGKSTQVVLSREYLAKRGVPFDTGREPGETEVGKQLRSILFTQDMHTKAEVLLFLGSRVEFVERKVRPALREGKHFIADRFTDSTLAYQGGARLGGSDETLRELRMLNAYATGRMQPDVTLLFDIDPEAGFRRKQLRLGDRIERAGLEFHERVRETYLQLAAQEPGRILVIDATPSVQEIFEEQVRPVYDRLFGL